MNLAQPSLALIEMPTGLFLSYIAAVGLTGVGLAMLAALPLRTTRQTRVINGALGAVALGYAFYLLAAPGSDVPVFWYVFAMPVVPVVRTVREALAARQAADHPAVPAQRSAAALLADQSPFAALPAFTASAPDPFAAPSAPDPFAAAVVPVYVEQGAAYTAAFPAGPVQRRTDAAAAYAAGDDQYGPAHAGSDGRYPPVHHAAYAQHPSPVGRASGNSAEARVLAAAARYRVPRGYAQRAFMAAARHRHAMH